MLLNENVMLAFILVLVKCIFNLLILGNVFGRLNELDVHFNCDMLINLVACGLKCVIAGFTSSPYRTKRAVRKNYAAASVRNTPTDLVDI